jgi:hypothetical protein
MAGRGALCEERKSAARVLISYSHPSSPRF